MLLFCLILWASSHILYGYENTTNTIWVAAGSGVSDRHYSHDGGLFLDRASIFAAGVRVSDDDTDGLGTGGDSADRPDLGVFLLPGSGPNHRSGREPAAVPGRWNHCRG